MFVTHWFGVANYRNLSTSNFFHVLNRGVDGQDIFFLDSDHRFWEAKIRTLTVKYGIRVHAYAWMSNHYHLMVDNLESSPDGLSNLMRDLQSAYASMLNERTRRRGPLFQSRFVAIPVDGDPQFLALARYIHRNPIAITGPAGVGLYGASSLAVYLGRREAPAWLHTARLAAMVDARRYLERVVRPESDDYFPRGFRPALEIVDVADVVDAVSRSWIRGDGGRALDATTDDLIAELLLSMRIADVVELARELDVSPKTLRNRSARARAMMATDPTLRGIRERSLGALDQVRQHSSAA